MLTLSEIESTQQFDFELRLEAMGEQALRAALADLGALQALAPAHLSRERVLQIATATLEDLVARSVPTAAPAAASAKPVAPNWFEWFTGFWLPGA